MSVFWRDSVSLNVAVYHFKFVQNLPYLQVVLLFLFLDPIECLLLWINTKRIPASLGSENTILNRQFIRGETLRCPSTDFHIVGEECVQLKWLTHGDAPTQDILLPLPSEHIPTEVPGEGAQVAEES